MLLLAMRHLEYTSRGGEFVVRLKYRATLVRSQTGSSEPPFLVHVASCRLSIIVIGRALNRWSHRHRLNRIDYATRRCCAVERIGNNTRGNETLKYLFKSKQSLAYTSNINEWSPLVLLGQPFAADLSTKPWVAQGDLCLSTIFV